MKKIEIHKNQELMHLLSMDNLRLTIDGKELYNFFLIFYL
jgi:hypothetical protein